MKTIASVNLEIPYIRYCNYDSGLSLQDYDIILFDPKLPYYPRKTYTDGSSSIEKTSGAQAIKSIEHWRTEIVNALKEGKTVFFLLSELTVDTYITGISSATTKSTTYNSSSLSNYNVTPFPISIINAKGSKMRTYDHRFNSLFDTLKDYIKYEVYLNEETKKIVATTSNGSKVLSAIMQLKDFSGNLVLLPYFDLEVDSFINENKKGEQVWSQKALGFGTKLINDLKEIDKVLTQQSELTPQPEWVNSLPKSKYITAVNEEISQIDKNIESIKKDKLQKEKELKTALCPTALLYETGRPLENAIESVLQQLGYTVSNFREKALEIDHIIVSPNGKRLIGESEGKDNSAISIDKFRQLETNINEDFGRNEIKEPASGILFGNGYRLKEPSVREIQFTEKCLVNAKRLSTVLIQTSDLFPIAMYLQDFPDDEDFKSKCRTIIESANGEIAKFPQIPNKHE